MFNNQSNSDLLLQLDAILKIVSKSNSKDDLIQLVEKHYKKDPEYFYDPTDYYSDLFEFGDDSDSSFDDELESVYDFEFARKQDLSLPIDESEVEYEYDPSDYYPDIFESDYDSEDIIEDPQIDESHYPPIFEGELIDEGEEPEKPEEIIIDEDIIDKVIDILTDTYDVAIEVATDEKTDIIKSEDIETYLSEAENYLSEFGEAPEHLIDDLVNINSIIVGETGQMSIESFTDISISAIVSHYYDAKRSQNTPKEADPEPEIDYKSLLSEIYGKIYKEREENEKYWFSRDLGFDPEMSFVNLEEIETAIDENSETYYIADQLKMLNKQTIGDYLDDDSFIRSDVLTIIL